MWIFVQLFFSFLFLLDISTLNAHSLSKFVVRVKNILNRTNDNDIVK